MEKTQSINGWAIGLTLSLVMLFGVALYQAWIENKSLEDLGIIVAFVLIHGLVRRHIKNRDFSPVLQAGEAFYPAVKKITLDRYQVPYLILFFPPLHYFLDQRGAIVWTSSSLVFFTGFLTSPVLMRWWFLKQQQHEFFGLRVSAQALAWIYADQVGVITWEQIEKLQVDLDDFGNRRGLKILYHDHDQPKALDLDDFDWVDRAQLEAALLAWHRATSV